MSELEQRIPDEDFSAADAQRLAEEERDRILHHRASLFVEVGKHPGFLELVAESDRKRARMAEQFKSFYLDGTLAIDQRQVDYDRGYRDGMRYIVAVVAAATNTLKKLDDKAAERERARQPVAEPDVEGGWE